jgi:hypothetical protein
MNVYGRAMTESKRKAHKNVVQIVLKAELPATAAASAEKDHKRTA